MHSEELARGHSRGKFPFDLRHDRDAWAIVDFNRPARQVIVDEIRAL